MDWREWMTLLIGTLLWVSFFALVTAAIVVWFRTRSEFQSAMPDDEEALAILERRRAAGEISEEEYRQVRQDLLE